MFWSKTTKNRPQKDRFFVRSGGPEGIRTRDLHLHAIEAKVIDHKQIFPKNEMPIETNMPVFNHQESSMSRATIFEIESPFLVWVQFGCSGDGNNGRIGRVGRKPPNFVEYVDVLEAIDT